MTTQAKEMFNLFNSVNQDDILIMNDNCFDENQNDSQTDDLKSYAEVLFKKLNNLIENLKEFIDERRFHKDNHLILIRYTNYPRELLYSREEEIIELIYKFIGKLKELRSFINELDLEEILRTLIHLKENRN